jgi:hypothetical protein
VIIVTLQATHSSSLLALPFILLERRRRSAALRTPRA